MIKLSLKDMYRTAVKPDRRCIGATLTLTFEEGEGDSKRTYTEKLGYTPLFDLKYGTNPNQPSQILVPDRYGFRVKEMRSLDRKAKGGPSLTNIEDTYWAARSLIYMDRPAAAVMKHENVSGIATASTLYEAFWKAFYGDWIAAYGGSACFNQQLDRATAELIAEHTVEQTLIGYRKIFKRFIDVVAAPDFDDGVLAVLEQRPNIRIFLYQGLDRLPRFAGDAYSPCLKTIGSTDDMLVLEKPWLTVYRAPEDLLAGHPTEKDTGIVTKRTPTDQELRDMHFGWIVAANLRSNGVAIVKNSYSLSPGTGQQDRVRAIRQAVQRGNELNKGRAYELNRDGLKELITLADFGFGGAVLASDGFVPFRDDIEECQKAGIKAIVQPGGSVHDQEVIDTADKYGMTMIFTGERSFRH